MGKIDQNKQRKAQAILQAAQSVFVNQGYVSAKMDEIADLAGVTKQTVYRYFPSKTALFKATLQYMGESAGMDCSHHLQHADRAVGLYNFAVDFISGHVSEQHIATHRLIINECGKAPEIAELFFEQGPDDMGSKVTEYFDARLKFEKPREHAYMWLSMLLGIRAPVLLGKAPPSKATIEAHAQLATDWLLKRLD